LLSAPLVDTDVPSHAGCGLCAGLLACYRLARWVCRHCPAYRGMDSPRDLAQRNEASMRLGAIPNTVQGSQLHITHTHRDIVGLRNGPNSGLSIVAYDISPPCRYGAHRCFYCFNLNHVYVSARPQSINQAPPPLRDFVSE